MHKKIGIVKIYIYLGVWYNNDMNISLDKNLKKIGVAVSGGADSMVLLSLLQKCNVMLSVINVDHGIRGEASACDSNFVSEYCLAHGLPFLHKKVDAVGYAAQQGLSVELAARELRYAFFEELLAGGKIEVVALAHHLDDQAETVLMRLFRGSGVRGLRGITDREGYIHPLLAYTKAEILDYAAANNVVFVQDATNTDTAYRRNFLRQEVLPLVETRYPQAARILGKTAAVLGEIDDYINKESTPYQMDGDSVMLPICVLDRHPAVAKASVANAIRALGITKDVEQTHLESILRLRDAQNNARINLAFGADVTKEYSVLRFSFRKEYAAFCQPFCPDKAYEYGGIRYTFVKDCVITKGTSFDGDKLPAGAVIRTRQAGDSFRRYRGGEKSLSDYLTDIKLPASRRNSLLVLAKASTVFAVLGIEIADGIKIDGNTANIIKVVLTKEIN